MYYFAYGSDLNRKQMSQQCRGSQPRLMATLPNYQLIFTGWSRKWRGGIASIKPFRGEKVFGAIYEISDRDLSSLDEYMGYPHQYSRLNVKVITEDGDYVEAVTYIKRVQAEETIPSPEYVATIQRGYKEWGIV